MRLPELSLRQDPDLRQELASLARGCDFVLPSRFKKRLKAFQQVRRVLCLLVAARLVPRRPGRSGRGRGLLVRGSLLGVLTPLVFLPEQHPQCEEVPSEASWGGFCLFFKRAPLSPLLCFSGWYRCGLGTDFRVG